MKSANPVSVKLKKNLGPGIGRARPDKFAAETNSRLKGQKNKNSARINSSAKYLDTEEKSRDTDPS